MRGLLIIFINLCRFLLSATFLLSGFAKAVDPQGMATKLNAYFVHIGWYFDSHGLTLVVLAISIAVFEFMLGVYLFLGMRRKLSTLVSFILMLMMTAITIYIYIYNPVPDCGCFGDALHLTHGETLLKNIILSFAAICLTFYPQHIKRLVSERNQWASAIVAFLYIFSIGLYSRHYLPLLDFTPYKTGTNIRAARNGELTEKELEQFALLWLNDKTGEDVTEVILADTGYTFLLTSSRLTTADDGVSDRINDLYDRCVDRSIKMYGLTASDTLAIQHWVDRTGAAYPFLTGETEVIETMVRSNPGLLLLKDGKIYRKWSANDLPEEEEFENALQAQSYDLLAEVSRLLLAFFIPLFFVIFADNMWVGAKYWKRYLWRRSIRKQQEN